MGADHNLVKMRAALNMITGQISEADKPEQVEGMKVWHKLVQEKFAKMNLNDKDIPQPMQSRKRAVESGINICRGIYEEASGIVGLHSLRVQNRRQVKSKEATSNRWMAGKTSRSVQQQIQTTADYSEEDFVVVANQKK